NISGLFGDQITSQDQQDIKTTVDALVDKIEISEFDLWIGTKDFQVYRLHLKTNAPSILSVVSDANTALNANSADLSHEEEIKKSIDSLKFSANLTYDADYFDFGKLNSVDAPDNATDMLSLLGDARAQSRDAKRLSDARQLASAFELYFNDNNHYPNS